jgi:hypothetical protein
MTMGIVHIRGAKIEDFPCVNSAFRLLRIHTSRVEVCLIDFL